MPQSQLLVFCLGLVSAINPRCSLKARLGLAIGGSTFALSLLAGLAISHTVKVQEEASIGRSLSELAYQMADKLDRGMFERYRDIQILATLDPVRASGYAPATRCALLEKLQLTYPDYAWIGLTNPQGIVLASTGTLMEGQNVSKRPWFSGAKAGPYVGDVHEAKLLAKLLPNPTQEPLRFVDVAVPVTNFQGDFQGVVGAHLSWSWAREVKSSLLGLSEQQNQVEVLVLNRAGQVLLGPSLEPKQLLNLASFQAALASQKSYRVEDWPDGRTYLSGVVRSQGYRNYPGLGWTVLVRQPAQVAFAPVRALQFQLFAWTAGLGVLFAGLGWILAGCLADPMLVLLTASDKARSILKSQPFRELMNWQCSPLP
ncbi:cache domain-containing protein [Leptolyngbya sp. FACHB-261]|uniref:cache domain-containing protein n=1 Tax=Leptolyngbya sp. FACHB-261 TaxID=2692806 RepID=UPI00168244A2|nr:cache domain-containing protein [Leptolyngbya sp. FACHB-261]MBD2101635.1 cache domain-containing protein [Leptolyngbya sp. FACHB-261]